MSVRQKQLSQHAHRGRAREHESGRSWRMRNPAARGYQPSTFALSTRDKRLPWAAFEAAVDGIDLTRGPQSQPWPRDVQQACEAVREVLRAHQLDAFVSADVLPASVAGQTTRASVPAHFRGIGDSGGGWLERSRTRDDWKAGDAKSADAPGAPLALSNVIALRLELAILPEDVSKDKAAHITRQFQKMWMHAFQSGALACCGCQPLSELWSGDNRKLSEVGYKKVSRLNSVDCTSVRSVALLSYFSGCIPRRVLGASCPPAIRIRTMTRCRRSKPLRRRCRCRRYSRSCRSGPRH